jgi:flagellar hook-associated protein 1 FlgK
LRSTFTGIETAMRAINAMQLALDTTTHNIANANTPGYSRQRVELSASTAYTVPSMYRIPQPIQIGAGVNIDSVERMRDMFTDRQIRSASGELGDHETTVRYYDRIEALINEPTATEFNGQLDRFWNAWSELALHPSNLSARAVVLEEGARVADAMNRTTNELANLRTDAANEIDFVVSDINDMAQEIADLNRDIRKLVGVGQTPNDLLDRRDLMIDELAKMTGATAVFNGDGTADVMIDGRALVSGMTFDQLQAQPAAGGNVDIVWASDLAAVTLSSSELEALQTMNNVTIPDVQADFDFFFNEIVDGVNTIHQGGYGLTDPAGPPPGRDFFSVAGGVYSVNAALTADPALVAAAQNAGQAGDNTNALAIAALATAKTMNGGTASYNEHYGLLVAGIGSDARRAINAAANQASFVGYLESQRQSVSGVSLDEEVANLVKFQHAYEAAARAMTSADEVLDTIINRMGLVGR